MSDSGTWQIDWLQNWDPELALWSHAGPGHTEPTGQATILHAGGAAAGKLVQAAMLGQLDQLEVPRILGALRQMQMDDGPKQGCFKWYWEEPEPIDTNAAFFIGLQLLVLEYCFKQDLDPAARALVDEMLAGLAPWFRAEVAGRHIFYPNKFLGDLVCGWLLHEALDLPDQDGLLTRVMLESADYWQNLGWGWAENMSDGYAGVCLRELSVLLLFSQRLPDEVRARYVDLLADLLALEDAFEGGPRVPALRSYAFARSPHHVNYRDQVRSLADELAAGSPEPKLENLLFDLGWHDLVPPRAGRAQDVSVPLWDHRAAVGHLQDDIRLGSVTRFPLMLSCEHHTWGLSWQSFPVCLWRPEGDWGFLQWAVEDAAGEHSHPAGGGFLQGYRKAALTHGFNPPVVGRTCSLQRGGDLLCLRLMPAIAGDWDRLTDRFRLLESHAEVEALPGDERWSQLLLRYPGREVSVQCLALTAPALPALVEGPEGALDWQLSCERPSAEGTRLMVSLQASEGLRMMVTLWGISLHGRITEPPQLAPYTAAPPVPRNPEEQIWQLTWRWPQTEWRVLLDPLADPSLVEA